jgi:tetratricopeptide (TPR) repeat protein
MRPTLEEIERKYYSTVPILQLLPQIEQLYGESELGTHPRAKAAVLMAIALVDRSEFAQAEHYFREAKEFASDHEDKWILADAIHGEALRPFKEQDFKTANSLERVALQYAIDAGHRNRQAVCHYMLGMIASYYASVDDAARSFGQALAIVQEEGYIRLQISVLNKLAELAMQWNHVEKARAYTAGCMEAARRLGSQQEIGFAYRGKIKLAIFEKNYDTALTTIKEVAAHLDVDDLRSWTNLHSSLGLTYAETGKFEEAIEELRLAWQKCTQSDTHVKANIQHLFAETYLMQKKYDLALDHVKHSMEFVDKSQSILVKRDALKLFHECYKGLERYKEAHEALEEYNKIISREQTDALNSRLEFHALKQEYETAQLREKEKERKAELLRIELERKDQDLVEKTKHLLKQTESLAQFRNDLKALVKRLPASDPVVQEVRERLKALPEEDLHWQDFDTQFNSLHPSFLHNLTVAFPELTPMERKVCPLLRLNLETEDIAKLLFLSERSVENHRYRIRKKLGLTTQQSLPDFLAQY